jgi:hypothetical protein
MICLPLERTEFFPRDKPRSLVVVALSGAQKVGLPMHESAAA